jgi:hypothetical protein
MPRIVRSGIENGSPSAKWPPRASSPPPSVKARPPASVAVKNVAAKSARWKRGWDATRLHRPGAGGGSTKSAGSSVPLRGLCS